MLEVIGMALPIPTESVQHLRGVQTRVGASRSVSATPTITHTTIRGGGLGGTTDLAVGGRPGESAMGATSARTYTAAGAIRRTRIHVPPGRIPTVGTMVRQIEPLSRTPNAALLA